MITITPRKIPQCGIGWNFDEFREMLRLIPVDNYRATY
jgi:hypothetical protein